MVIDFKRNKILLLFIGLVGGFSSCSRESSLGDEPNQEEEQVSVSFLAKATSADTPDDDLDNLIFRRNAQGEVVLCPSSSSLWVFNGQSYEKKQHLQVGSYHFAFTKGLQRTDSEIKGQEGNNCFLVENFDFHKDLTSYKIIHPNDGEYLKYPVTDLFLDASSDSVNKINDLATDSKLKYSRTLVHAQGRLDLLFCRTDASIYSAEPFNRISSIQLDFSGINSNCCLGTQEYSVPRKLALNYRSEELTAFNLEDYKSEFQDVESSVLEKMEGWTEQNSRIIKTKFFPSGNFDLKLTVTYVNGVVKSYDLNSLNVARNRATLILVYVKNEQMVISPDLSVVDKPLDFLTEAVGEDGFWN